jgi:hypothetical protein
MRKLIFLTIIVGIFLLAGCRKRERNEIKAAPTDTFTVYIWKKSRSEVYADSGGVFRFKYVDTTGNDTDKAYSFKICERIKRTGDDAFIVMMDSALEKDVKTVSRRPEARVPVIEGRFMSEGDTSLARVRINIDSVSGIAYAETAYLIVKGDSLNDTVYLDGSETGPALQDSIRKAAARLGSPSPKAATAMLIKNTTELSKRAPR